MTDRESRPNKDDVEAANYPGKDNLTVADATDVQYISFVDKMLDFSDVLELLRHNDSEFTPVCHRSVVDRTFASTVLSPSRAARLAGKRYTEFSEPHDSWFGPNPTAGPERFSGGRGTERDITRWAALYLDLDIKDGAFVDLDQTAEFIHVLSGMLRTRPSAVIFSGHGVQPLWPIEDGRLDTAAKWDSAYRLSRWFGRLAATVAWREFSVSLDTVADLCRVLRMPGTFNWKNPSDPCPTGATRDGGGPLTLQEIEEALDEWAPEIATNAPVTLRRSAREVQALRPKRRFLVLGALRARRALVRTVAEAAEGNRNKALLWAACRAVENGLMTDLGDSMWSELYGAAVHAGLRYDEVAATLRSAMNIAGNPGDAQ